MAALAQGLASASQAAQLADILPSAALELAPDDFAQLEQASGPRA